MGSCVLTSVVYLQGTGTKIGDREEMAALAATIGSSHSTENKLIVGSVKSNVSQFVSWKLTSVYHHSLIAGVT